MEATQPQGALRPLRKSERFFAFGMVGLATEVTFTALTEVLTGRGDRRLQGYTYLWMPPIWGAGGMLCETLGARLRARGLGVLARGAAYAALCLGVEYVTGALLRGLTGRCPWEEGYRRARAHVHGLIRLDYAPWWALAGLAGEHVCALFSRVRLAPRPYAPHLLDVVRPGCNAVDEAVLKEAPPAGTSAPHLLGARTGARGEEARLPAEAPEV